MENWASLLPLVAIVVIFWFLVIRPARARQRDYLSTQRALSPGDRVMLASGIHGEVVSIGDDTVELEIAPGTVVTVARQAVGRILSDVTDQPVVDEPTADEPGAPEGDADR